MNKFYTKTVVALSVTMSLALSANALESQNAPLKSFVSTSLGEAKMMQVETNRMITAPALSESLKSQKLQAKPSKAPARAATVGSDIVGQYLLVGDVDGDNTFQSLAPDGCFIDEGDSPSEVYIDDFGKGYLLSNPNSLKAYLTYAQNEGQEYNFMSITAGQTLFTSQGAKYIVALALYGTDIVETSEYYGQTYLILVSNGEGGYADIDFMIYETGIDMFPYDFSSAFKDYVIGMMVFNEETGSGMFIAEPGFMVPNGVSYNAEPANTAAGYVETQYPVLGIPLENESYLVVYNYSGMPRPIVFAIDKTNAKATATNQVLLYYVNDIIVPFYAVSIPLEEGEDWPEQYVYNAQLFTTESGTTGIYSEYWCTRNYNYDLTADYQLVEGTQGVTYQSYFVTQVEFDSVLLHNVDAAINDVIVDENAPAEFYNMQGMKVNNPKAGQVYIKKQGNKVAKIKM